MIGFFSSFILCPHPFPLLTPLAAAAHPELVPENEQFGLDLDFDAGVSEGAFLSDDFIRERDEFLAPQIFVDRRCVVGDVLSDLTFFA
jgi:hypothetical protein